MNYTKTYDSDAIKSAFKEIIETVSKKNSQYNTARLNQNNALISKNIFSLLTETYSSSSGLSAMLVGILMEHIFESEKICPGSGTNTLNNIIGVHRDNNHLIFKDLCLDNLDSSLDFLSISSEAKEIVKNCIHLAGLHSRIFIEKGKTRNTIIELKESYNFSLLLPIGPFFGEKKWERNWCKCLCVDGVIETLGEIDGILQDAATEKLPLAIFARGFSYDVINTIKVNNDRRTTDVSLISFGVDNLETLNSIADIAAILNSDIITPLKGDAIAAQKFATLPIIEKIICGSGNVSLINTSTANRVASHVSNLEKRSNSSSIDITGILNKRIKSLTGKCVTVKLRCESAQQQNMLLEEIDTGIKAMNSMIAFGTNIDIKLGLVTPAAMHFASKKMSQSFMKCINSIEVAIVED